MDEAMPHRAEFFPSAARQRFEGLPQRGGVIGRGTVAADFFGLAFLEQR